VGATGIRKSGKPWLAAAFADRACPSGYAAYSVRVPRLSQDLDLARGDGSYTRLLAKLAKTAVLVLDDFGLTALTGPHRQDLLGVIRYSSPMACATVSRCSPASPKSSPAA
jgi:DNA replication protein DnaC